jgi:hypothetical protein
MGRRQCELEGCPSGLLVAAHRTALLMAAANGAKRRDVPSRLLQAARFSASRMAGAGAARRWTAPSPL